MAVLVRFGLVALASTLLVEKVFGFAPITLDSSAWYFGRSLVTLALLGALALYAFWTALGRHKAVSLEFLDDE